MPAALHDAVAGAYADTRRSGCSRRFGYRGLSMASWGRAAVRWTASVCPTSRRLGELVRLLGVGRGEIGGAVPVKPRTVVLSLSRLKENNGHRRGKSDHFSAGRGHHPDRHPGCGGQGAGSSRISPSLAISTLPLNTCRSSYKKGIA